MHNLVIDSGLGSRLEELLPGKVDSHPMWSARVLVEHPEIVQQVHLENLKAGADIIVTSSYQLSFQGCKQHLGVRNKEEFNELVGKSVAVAAAAVEQCLQERSSNDTRPKPKIAGSCGAYGAWLHDGSEFHGNYKDMTHDELVAWHGERMAAFVGTNVDLLAIETIPSLEEAVAAVEAANKYAPEIPFWVTMSCKDDQHVCHGESLLEALQAIRSNKNLVGFGVNCTNPLFVSNLVHSISDEAQSRNPPIAIVVYPNSGESYSGDWEGNKQCSDWKSAAAQWLKDGVCWIGSCCRTSYLETDLIRKALDDYQRTTQP